MKNAETWDSSVSAEDDSRGGSTHSLLQLSNLAAEYSYLSCVEHNIAY